jgi:hypothetical protein
MNVDEKSIIQDISDALFQEYSTFMNEHMLNYLYMMSNEYMYFLLQQFTNVVSSVVSRIIPLYELIIKTTEIENKLNSMSSFYITNMMNYIDSLDYTISYHRKLVCLDRYMQNFCFYFTNKILHDNSVNDPISIYISLVKSAYKIQKQYKMSISNPAYKMCRERLMKEYKEMSQN